MGNPTVPEGFLAFGIISIFLLTGLLLRTFVKPFQKWLVPSCMLGGLVGFAVMNSGLISITPAVLGTFTYHFFCVSFISLSLAGTDKSSSKRTGAHTFRATLQFALIFLIAMFGQSCVGGLITWLMNGSGMDVFPQFGIMVGPGFAQGPGQAIAMGKMWESSGLGGGVELSQQIGLIFASLGFVCAFFIGIPVMNWGIKRGLAKHIGDGVTKEVEVGLLEEDTNVFMGKQTTHAANIDTLAVHFALMGISYLIAYGIGMLIEHGLIPLLPLDNPKRWIGFNWAMFFLWGLMGAGLVRFVMDRIGCSRVVNSDLQHRITGCSVDFLIVCTLMGVKFAVVARYIVPIGIVSAVVAVGTLAVCYWFCRRFERDQLEQFGALFGTCTGTAATGVLLARLVDPQFKTPAAYATAAQNFICLPGAQVAMFLYAAPFVIGMSMPMTIALLGGCALLCVALLFVFRLVKKPAW